MNETRAPRRSSLWLKALPGVLVVVLIAAWWILRDDRREPSSPEPDAAAMADETSTGTTDDATPARPNDDPARRRWRNALGRDPSWPEPFVPGDCAVAWRDLSDLCSVLDSGGSFGDVEGGSCAMLTGIVASLEENPPALQGELSDLLDIRHSVSHLLRTLGPDRMLRLAALIADDRDLTEPMAMAIYRWSAAGGSCEPAPMDSRAQYAHAAWLLRTIGGQAYLRRRLPRHEALATYYALRVLDGSVENGYDPAGVDLRHDIDRTIALIDGEDDLVFRERYLEDLRAMRERWARRTGNARR